MLRSYLRSVGWYAAVLLAMTAGLSVLIFMVPAQAGNKGLGRVNIESEARVALVIGNANYPTKPLANPAHDARAMASALRALGFDVIEKENVGKSEMERAIGEFGDKLTEGAVGLVYYSGHGLQVNGKNYLVPIDAVIRSERQAPVYLVDADTILAQMTARSRLNLLILDACRDNPFERSFRSAGGGLAQMNAPEGTLIAYATAPGKTASDGSGRNGLYTQELLKALQTPGLTVEQVFKRVRAAVSSSSNGDQIPWEASSLVGEFYFSGEGSSPPDGQAPAVTPVDRDALFWQSIQASTDAADFESYLKQFPSGTYADLARRRIAQFRRTQTAVMTPVPPPPSYETNSGPSSSWRPGKTFRDCPECPEMVVLPAGTFTMGPAPGEEEGENVPAESRGLASPPHEVTIDYKLAVGRYTVTRGEFAAFIRDTGRGVYGCWIYDGKDWVEDTSKNWQSPGFGQTDRHPAICVNWDDGNAYAQWLSQRTGHKYRLLSEAEWEYAARAGTTTRRYWGDDSSHTQQCSYANGADQSEARVYNLIPGVPCDDNYANTSPVGTYRPNGFGLYDMQGNVEQWVGDCYNNNYQGAPDDGSAWLAGSCEFRSSRGGSWFNIPWFIRAANRGWGTPTYRYTFIGFRVARTASP